MTVLALVDIERAALQGAIARELRHVSESAGKEFELLDLTQLDLEAPFDAGRRILAAASDARAHSRNLLVVGANLHDYVQTMLLSVAEVMFLGWTSGSSEQKHIQFCLQGLHYISGGIGDRQVFVLSECLGVDHPEVHTITETVKVILVPRREIAPDELHSLQSTLQLFGRKEKTRQIAPAGSVLPQSSSAEQRSQNSTARSPSSS